MSEWVIVQHSAFGYGNDGTFMQGLETRMITTKKERNMVVKVGGLIFQNYNEAEDFCMDAMYDNNPSIVPFAKGAFSGHKIDDLAIYIPIRKAVG